MNLSPQALCLIAKSNRQSQELWLPVWMHLRDTAEVMERLACEWLPPHAQEVLSDSPENLRRLARFLGAAHDLGKATPAFQKRISVVFKPAPDGCVHDVLRRLSNRGLDISIYAQHEKDCGLYHNLDSQVLLLNAGCPDGVAAVIGAHHGNPTTEPSYCEYVDYLNENVHYFAEKRRNKGNLWFAVYEELTQFILEISGFATFSDIPELNMSQQLAWSGLLVMADWVASNGGYFPYITSAECPDNSEYDLQRVEDGLNEFAYSKPWKSIGPQDDREIMRERFGFKANAMQSMVVDAIGKVTTPGLFILEAQMGTGKSEAALAMLELLARDHGAGGFFWGMPTQVTTNAIFNRILAWTKDVADNNTIRLAHGLAEFNKAFSALTRKGDVGVDGDEFACEGDEGDVNINDDSPDRDVFVHPWFQGSKRTLLSDFVVGTVDQVLLAALQRKHVMLRHLGLLGKVVVIDECHAYDTYMSCYLDRALQWLGAYRVPVIMLSATLPAQRRSDLVKAYIEGSHYQLQGKEAVPLSDDDPWCQSQAYPLLTYTDGQKVCQKSVDIQGENLEVALERVLLPSEPEDQLSALVEAVSSIKDGGCAGIICNTVRKAQRIYDGLKEAYPECKIVLYHAQFMAQDRLKREQQILDLVGKNSTPERRNENKVIIVGTQVLEQSLDLDFDLLLTELCPMDLLLQRVGRLHRHEKLRLERGESRPQAFQKARCLVLDMADGSFDKGSARVYSPWLLLRTRAFLPFLPEKLSLPCDISPLVQKVYGTDDLALVCSAEEDRNSLQALESRYKEQYERDKKSSANRAKQFLLYYPELNRNINGLLQVGDVFGSEQQGQAAVRDGQPSIDVLVMRRLDNGEVAYLPQAYGGEVVPLDRQPDREEERRIACQRLRLPAAVCNSRTNDGSNGGSDQLKRLIEELKQNSNIVAQWQDKNSHYLRDELFLLFDENLQTDLAGFRLTYDEELGLQYERL